MEGICALLFTLILMFPLVIQLQMLIVNPKKLCSAFHYYASDEADEAPAPQLLQFYPKESPTVVARSGTKPFPTSLRTTSSLPAVPRALSITGGGEQAVSQLPEARRSSAPVDAGEVLSVADIAWTYSSCRHEAFEACLRDYYGAMYPPGQVVLNSMHLNLLDSRTRLGLSVAGLFDFVKDSEPALNGPATRKLKIECHDPLDHFVTRRPSTLFTADRFTDTGALVRRASSHDELERDDDGTRDAINRRSSRKVEPVCKFDLYRKEEKR